MGREEGGRDRNLKSKAEATVARTSGPTGHHEQPAQKKSCAALGDIVKRTHSGVMTCGI
jgi:hypothetical protein